MYKNKETREKKVGILLEYLKNKNYQSLTEELKINSLKLKDKKLLLEHNKNIIIKTFFNSIIELDVNELSQSMIEFIDVYVVNFIDLKIKIIDQLFINVHNNKEKFRLNIDIEQYNLNKTLPEDVDSEASTEEFQEGIYMLMCEDSVIMGESSNDS